MFAIGGLSCLILLFVCIFVEKRCERSGGFWGEQLRLKGNKGVSLDEPRPFYITYPNPAIANLEEFEEFLKKNEYYVPKWWELIQEEGEQFTPEQTKLIEDYITTMFIKGRSIATYSFSYKKQKKEEFI
ncbi:MAG: hypothetical protein RSC04_03165 [Bacteroidales bacterium]